MRRRRNRDTFPPVPGPILAGYRGKHGNNRTQDKPYGLEVAWRAIPSILAAAAPHRGGSSTNDARLVDEGNSIHLVREKREYDEVRW